MYSDWFPSERNIIIHEHFTWYDTYLHIIEANKTWSNPPDKRRVKFLENNNGKTSAAHIAIEC